jgi:hypothetical protein
MAVPRQYTVRPQDRHDAATDAKDDPFASYDPDAVVALLNSFLNVDERPEDQQTSLVALMDAIDEDRAGARRIFPFR